MKDFRDILEVSENSEIGFRIFKKIEYGEIELSIQASRFHRCIPQGTINIREYTHMEIAILNSEDFEEIENSIILKGFKRLEELKEYFNGECVGSYVPIDLIQELYCYLETQKIRRNNIK